MQNQLKAICVSVGLLAVLAFAGTMLMNKFEPEYLWYRANHAVTASDFPVAERYLQRIVQHDPDAIEAHLLLARLYRRRANAGDAAISDLYLRTLQNIVRLRPEDTGVYERTVEQMQVLGRTADAQAAAKTLVEKGGGDAAALRMVATAALKEKNLKLAQTAVERLVETSSTPIIADALLQISIYKAAGRQDSLQAVYARVLPWIHTQPVAAVTFEDPKEQAALTALLTDSIRQAPDADEACTRFHWALDVLESLEGGNAVVGKRVSGLVAALRARGPLGPNAPEELKEAYRSLFSRADEILVRTVSTT